jgi:hypothetical protein
MTALLEELERKAQELPIDEQEGPGSVRLNRYFHGYEFENSNKICVDS